MRKCARVFDVVCYITHTCAKARDQLPAVEIYFSTFFFPRGLQARRYILANLTIFLKEGHEYRSARTSPRATMPRFKRCSKCLINVIQLRLYSRLVDRESFSALPFFLLLFARSCIYFIRWEWILRWPHILSSHKWYDSWIHYLSDLSSEISIFFTSLSASTVLCCVLASTIARSSGWVFSNKKLQIKLEPSLVL